MRTVAPLTASERGLHPLEQPRITLEAWAVERDARRLGRWLARSSPSTVHVLDAWVAAVTCGWLAGAQKVWDAHIAPPGIMIERAWYLIEQSWKQALNVLDVGDKTKVHEHPCEAFLTDLTWGPALNDDHAKAQHHAQVAALTGAMRCFKAQRWEDFLTKGVELSFSTGRSILTQLLDHRFGINGPLLRDDFEALDRCLDLVLARSPKVLCPPATLHLVALANDPLLGLAAQQRALQVLQHSRFEGRLSKLVTMAKHGLVLQTLSPPAPSDFCEAFFQAWIAHDAQPTMVLTQNDAATKHTVASLFQSPTLSVTYDPMRSLRPDATYLRHRQTHQATFASCVHLFAGSTQTFHVAEHWFAAQLPEFNVDVPLSPEQRQECVKLWNIKVETPLLREVLDADPVEPPRPRARL